MAASLKIIASWTLQLGQPSWLLAGLLAVPMAVLAWRNLAALGAVRRAVAIVLRVLVVGLLAALLARPTLTSKNEQLTVITVIDRSMSIPDNRAVKENQSPAHLAWMSEAMKARPPGDLLGIVDVAEAPAISRLPSGDITIPAVNPSLDGMQSKLSSGLEMAMAIAPPNSAVRILLVSDGNETAGDLRDTARAAAANRIPIDVLPIRYKYSNEVVFKSLFAPVKARSGQTVPLRFVLESTAPARGKIYLNLNGKPVRLGDAEDNALAVTLAPGTNVRTVSLPVGTRGMHEFDANFVPDDPRMDSLEPNNHASAITFVAGPGHVMIVDTDGKSGAAVAKALAEAKVDARRASASDFPTRLAELMDCDAIILANVNVGSDTLSYQQQEMICRYVTEIGGGLVMVGGDTTFGAGGWIGSPVADILPVDLDPPQKKQLPKGALCLIMHACEMPKGNFWGKEVAKAAINTLSKQDLVGVLEYGNMAGGSAWVYQLQEVGNKSAAIAAVNQMQMGDMPDFGAPMQAAHDALAKVTAVQKHVIIISDGDPQPPSPQLLLDYKKAGITCSGVTIYPHGGDNLKAIAIATGGRAYLVDKNPDQLPQIFIKEAQVVRRALIVEEQFTPAIRSQISELVRGLDALPPLEGYVLTGPKGGLNQIVMTNKPGADGDPILATGQSGLGRVVAFTSSADSRWAAQWLAWGGFNRFWEQTIRWVAKSSQSSDCEVYPDVQGRDVTLTVESVDDKGKFVQFSNIVGKVIAPDMTTKDLVLTQVGPGRYRANFQAAAGGSYLVNLQYRKVGPENAPGLNGSTHTAVIVPFAPEFRDLSDNAAMMAEVARITGGRIIGADPKQADIFSRQGVKFPQTALPLTAPLIFVWLGLFLMDVASRRIVLDVVALLRRARAALPSLRIKKTADATIDRLKSKRQEFLDQLAARKKDARAGARFEAPAGGAPAGLDTSAMPDKAAALGEDQAPAQAQAPPPKPAPKPPQEATPLQKLLDAKKRTFKK
ncbi:MAG: glutamine amidotransferase [Phycisphaerae bacterium]